MFGNRFGTHTNVECGLISFVKRAEGEQLGEPCCKLTAIPIPLESVIIRASLISAVAKVELTQIYVNKEEQPIEAIYYFPVDSNAGVTHFQAELEGRTLEGVVKPIKEAEAQYEKAVEQQSVAFLLESKKPDIFKVRVGFLQPGAKVKITIGYITEVKNEAGTNSIRFFIPTTVAPRYIPSGETGKEALDLENMVFSLVSPAPLSITVNVAIQGNVKSIESPTHKIVVEHMESEKKNWTRAVVQLFGKTTDLDRDFVLLVVPTDTHIPRLYSETLSDSTAIMAHLIPSFNLYDEKVELIFVLDRSGSMQGPSIELAKQALILFIHSLPVDSYFNIVGFGSTYQFLFPCSVKYDDTTLRKAIEHCTSLDADLGGTEIFEPLSKIFKQNLVPEYLRQIFVLTDGEVGNTEDVIRLCRENSDQCRVFALGIGDSASHYLVNGMAFAGGGTAGFVCYEEAIEAKVLHQLKNATQASLSNVRIKWIGIEAEDDSTSETPLIEINKDKTLLGYGKPIPGNAVPVRRVQKYLDWRQAPENVPPVFDGSQLLIFGLFSGKSLPIAVQISADSPDGPLSVNVELTENSDAGSNCVLHKLAAIKTVRELQQKIEQIENSDSAGAEMLINELVDLACKFGIVTKYTAYIAVDDSTDAALGPSDNWALQTRYVPSQFAHGWHGHEGASYRGGYPQFCSFDLVPEAQSRKKRVIRGKSMCPSPGFTGLFGCAGGNSAVFAARKKTAVQLCSSNDLEPISMEECDFEEYRPVAAPFQNKSKVSGKSTPKDYLHAIVATQSYNGSFSLDECFAHAIVSSLEELKTECEQGNWDKQAWATALALTFMEEKLSDFKESWELVAMKAKKWLEVYHNSDKHLLITAAKVFFERSYCGIQNKQ